MASQSIVPEAKHSPAVQSPQLEGIMASLATLSEVLLHQAEVMNEITDGGNENLPGLIASGTANTMVWAARQIKNVRESLGEVAQNAQPKPSPSSVM